MVKKEVVARSGMQVSLITRLLGMTTTLFILILTIKVELLDYHIITWQLALAIPLLFASLIVGSKIVDESSFVEHKMFSLFVNSVAIALVVNSIGLLITKYISSMIGFAYFVIFILVYGYFMAMDWKDNKIHNELLVLIILILFGLVPAYFVLT